MLKKKEKAILSHLRNNARITLTDIARKEKMPLTSVFDIVNKMSAKYIHKYTSLLDYQKMGYGIRSTILLNTENINEIKENQNINNIYKLNDSNFLINTVFQTFSEHENFKVIIKKLDKNYSEHFILEEIKHEEFQL